MDRTPSTIILTWAQASLAAVTLGAMIGGPLILQCLQMRDAVSAVKRVSNQLAAHLDDHRSTDRYSRDRERTFEGRLGRLEGRVAR